MERMGRKTQEAVVSPQRARGWGGAWARREASRHGGLG